MKRVYPEPNTGCWIWVGRTNSDGYGHIHKNDLGILFAHRYSYALHKGPIGDNCVLHTCDVRRCVNPDHLYLGDNAQNVRDRDARKRRNAIGHKNGRTKLTIEQVLSIRREYVWFKVTLQKLSDKYGTSICNVRSIILRKTWSHI